MSKVACVVLNYRGSASALRAIEAVASGTFRDVEIFAVENGSGDDSLAVLSARLGADHVVSTPVNLGFAGGMNLGLKRALETDAEYFWILSKDIQVSPNSLQILMDLYPRLDRPGMLGSLTDLNATDDIYFFQALIDARGHTRHGTKGRKIPEIPELRQEYGPTDYVNGSCVFMHRSVLDKVGLISEDYFLYFEDCDWGLRAKRAGFLNYVSYRARVHHYRPVGAFNRTAEYYCRRNSFIFKKKHGFTRPWTKSVELFKQRKAALKSWWRGDETFSAVLRDAIRDISEEKTGLGPYR